jgi:hypothetical protein
VGRGSGHRVACWMTSSAVWRGCMCVGVLHLCCPVLHCAVVNTACCPSARDAGGGPLAPALPPSSTHPSNLPLSQPLLLHPPGTHRAEYCRSVQDFIARRTRLAFLDTAACAAAIPKVTGCVCLCAGDAGVCVGVLNSWRGEWCTHMHAVVLHTTMCWLAGPITPVVLR